MEEICIGNISKILKSYRWGRLTDISGYIHSSANDVLFIKNKNHAIVYLDDYTNKLRVRNFVFGNPNNFDLVKSETYEGSLVISDELQLINNYVKTDNRNLYLVEFTIDLELLKKLPKMFDRNKCIIDNDNLLTNTLLNKNANTNGGSIFHILKGYLHI